MSVWAQMLSRLENAIKVSICGLIKLIALYYRARRRLNRNNRCQQIASLEYPDLEVLDVSGRHCCHRFITHNDSPWYLWMFWTVHPASDTEAHARVQRI